MYFELYILYFVINKCLKYILWIFYRNLRRNNMIFVYISLNNLEYMGCMGCHTIAANVLVFAHDGRLRVQLPQSAVGAEISGYVNLFYANV